MIATHQVIHAKYGRLIPRLLYLFAAHSGGVNALTTIRQLHRLRRRHNIRSRLLRRRLAHQRRRHCILFHGSRFYDRKQLPRVDGHVRHVFSPRISHGGKFLVPRPDCNRKTFQRRLHARRAHRTRRSAPLHRRLH